MIFPKIFNRDTGFEQFKKVYRKFIDEEVKKLKYHSELGYIPRVNNPVFEEVNLFFIENGTKATYSRVPYMGFIHSDLVEKKGYDNENEYTKDVWNRYRKIYNRNPSEVREEKKHRLKILNKKKYPEYFANASISIDILFESESTKRAFRKNSFQFEKLVLIVLCGKYTEIGIVQENLHYFPAITSEFTKRLENIIPRYKNDIIPKCELGNVFVRELTRLKKILLNIQEHEHIINTINKFEDIFYDNESGITEIPCYTEYNDPLIDSKNWHSQDFQNDNGLFKENLYNWIEQTARNIQSDTKCKFKSYKVIEYYLRVLIKNKQTSISDLTKEVLKYDILEEDKRMLEAVAHNTKGNWEKKLLEEISNQNHSSFIKFFKRKHNVLNKEKNQN